MAINKITTPVAPTIKKRSTILCALQKHIQRTANIKASVNVAFMQAGKIK